MLKSVNLCLSSLCSANCIFCPSNRGKCINAKLMPFECFKKIVDDISSETFKKKHRLNKVVIGENGDAFLNKELIRMLRYLRLKEKEIDIILYSNFKNFNKEIAKIIIEENLVDLIRTNIDGSNYENYYNAKRLDLKIIDKNIKDFIDLRSGFSSKIPIYISVLTLNKYIWTIYNNFGFYPIKIKNENLKKVKDDFKAIKSKYKKIIKADLDKIFDVYGVFGWAERDKIDVRKINYKKYACPNLIRIKHEAFIAPDGTWYACCFDSANELSLGNINENLIDEIYSSEKRKQLIKQLSIQEFKKVGGPCATVNCCQIMHKNVLISVFFRLLFKNKLLTKFLYQKYNYRKIE